jgi:hypothetical protein
MSTTNSVVLTTREAKIILDWDDGQWYVSDIDYGNVGDNTDGGTTSTSSTSASQGVKVPEWDSSYKYAENDIVANGGTLYVSRQNHNQGNSPTSGTFWWGRLVDYSNIDAITLEGKNLNEVVKSVLGGNAISDFYKKTEADNIILTYFNNVDAKRLGSKTLTEIQTHYTALISAAESRAKQYTNEYLTDTTDDGLDKLLLEEFNDTIMPDTVNSTI